MVINSFHVTTAVEPRIFFVIWLLNTYSCPNIEQHTQYYAQRGDSMQVRGTYGCIHIPQDSIDDDVVAVGKGYSGPSKSYYCRSVGATIEMSHLMQR